MQIFRCDWPLLRAARGSLAFSHSAVWTHRVPLQISALQLLPIELLAISGNYWLRPSKPATRMGRLLRQSSTKPRAVRPPAFHAVAGERPGVALAPGQLAS